MFMKQRILSPCGMGTALWLTVNTLFIPEIMLGVSMTHAGTVHIWGVRA